MAGLRRHLRPAKDAGATRGARIVKGADNRSADGNQVNHRRIEATLFAVSFLTFSYFYQAADQSTAARFDLMRSLLERHTLWIDGFCGWNTADIVRVSGHYYSVKAPGGSLTGILQWMFWKAFLTPLQHTHAPLFWTLTTYLTIVFSTSLLVAILSIVFYRFALFLGASPGRSVGLALILMLGTIMFPYATEMTGEPIAGVCAFTSFYLLATHRERGGDRLRALAAGLLAGWAVLNDYPSLLIAAPLGIYALFKLRRAREIVSFTLGAALVAALMFAYNKLAFGSYFFFSYEAFKLPGNTQFPEQAIGFVGLTYPRWAILCDILLNAPRGLFFCNPVLILAIPGLVCFWKERGHRAELAVALFAVVGMILFNASYGRSIVSWGGGTATGPRQITSAIPFMVLLMVYLPAEWDYLIGGLGVLSVFLMLAATSVEPHLPYEYSNPLRDFTMPAFFRGDLAYNANSYFDRGSITGDSVAFNLGKLAGLPGTVQLLPLGIVWMLAAVTLLGGKDGNRLIQTAAIIAVAAIFIPPVTGPMRRAVNLKARHGLLGRYYSGFSPGGFPPHIVRVDRSLEFNNVAELGALLTPSNVQWTGDIRIDRPGFYLFMIRVDDAGWLSIDGVPVIPDPGRVTHREAAGVIYLSRGEHRIEAGERNLFGDASFHLEWKPPGRRLQRIPASMLNPEVASTALR